MIFPIECLIDAIRKTFKMGSIEDKVFKYIGFEIHQDDIDKLWAKVYIFYTNDLYAL